jgi:structure-specific recognition protein 1
MVKVAQKPVAKAPAPVAAKKPKKKDDDEAYTTKADKVGKEKDPNAPKRPQSSYFLFMNERRPALQKEKPELKFGDLTKQLTEDWKSLSEKDRKKYDDMAAKDKERYEKEMEDAGLKKEKKEDGPKKPQSSFFLYSADMRDKYKKSDPDLKFGDVAKKIAEDWKKADAKTKEKYEKKAKEDRERYEKEKAATEDKTAASSEAGSKATKKAAKPAAKKAKKDTASDEEGEDGDE